MFRFREPVSTALRLAVLAFLPCVGALCFLGVSLGEANKVLCRRHAYRGLVRLFIKIL